jgi:predicted PurR-regulated permease PerM
LAHVEALALALSLRSSLLLLLLLLALLALFALLASDFFPYALPLALAGVGGYMLRCWSTWNNRWPNVNQ